MGVLTVIPFAPQIPNIQVSLITSLFPHFYARCETPFPTADARHLQRNPTKPAALDGPGALQVALRREEDLHEYEASYVFSKSYLNAEREGLVAGTGDAAGAVDANIETNEAGGDANLRREQFGGTRLARRENGGKSKAEPRISSRGSGLRTSARRS